MQAHCLYGALFGDIAGSTYEFHPVQNKEFALWPAGSRFTDDTVLTLAVAKAVQEGWSDEEKTRRACIQYIREFARAFPVAGYGPRFERWVFSRETEPYGSCGNGSAMRVSPVGWAYDSLEECDRFAAASAAVTHNHPEGVRGAQVVAAAILLARKKTEKSEMRRLLEERYHYDLSSSLEAIHSSGYGFDSTCQGSVPQALIAFFEANSSEGAIRNAIALRADADTQAAIAGSIAEAYYGLPDGWQAQVQAKLPEVLLTVLLEWNAWWSSKHGMENASPNA